MEGYHPDILRFWEMEEDGYTYHFYVYKNAPTRVLKKSFIGGTVYIGRQKYNYEDGSSITISDYELERFAEIEQQIKSEEEQKLKAIEERKQQQLIAEEKRKALQAEQEAIAKQASVPKITDQIVHQLKELHALKEAGILTEDEFNAKKKQMLGL